MTNIPIHILKEALEYDPETGLFVWRIRPESHFRDDARWSAAQSQKRWNTNYAGRSAFAGPTKNGYLSGVLFRVRMLSHRVAWAMSYGQWPSLSVDHINGVRHDNRLANLRLATRQEQSRNTTSARGSTSRFLGVSFRKERNVWRANIFLHGRQTALGSFSSEEDAAKAYDLAAQAHFGEFARLNFPPSTR